jgi:hypothetical protein
MVRINSRELKVLVEWSTGNKEILTINTSLPKHCILPESETLKLVLKTHFPDLPLEFKVLATSFLPGVPDEMHESLCDLSLQLDNLDEVTNPRIREHLGVIKLRIEAIMKMSDLLLEES